MIALWVALAGGAGAVARFVVDGAWRARRPDADLPWGTIVVNVSGSLLLGVVTGLVIFAEQPSTWRTVVGTGFCGGYTTFSTTSVETVRLLQRGKLAAAAANAVGTLVLCVAAAAAGLLLTYA